MNLKVRDMKESKRWYTEVLGLKVHKDYGTTVVFSFGEEMSAALCLIETGEAVISGDTYPVLQISEEYKDVLYKNLVEKGVRVESNPGHLSHFKFYDPDGNMLEAYCPGIYEKN
ncbi:VOC family protein [Bacillus sp. MCCB 382]|uniref:VOC family protein n=1 Tax=Bacillus sp. MCCB 382 TaxID=2860197 RepID=UPI001C55AE34|nr:VOC family protein [Bacillus sp. MCCB 382]